MDDDIMIHYSSPFQFLLHNQGLASIPTVYNSGSPYFPTLLHTGSVDPVKQALATEFRECILESRSKLSSMELKGQI